MTVTIPEYVTAKGNIKVVWVPALADPTKPKVSELTAPTAVDLSCYMMPDWDGPNGEQPTSVQERFCSRQTFEDFDNEKWSIPPIPITFLPQGAPTDPANLAHVALTKGNTGFVVAGWGIEPAVDFAADDVVTVLPAKAGLHNKPAKPESESAPITAVHAIAVTGAVHQDVKVVTV